MLRQLFLLVHIKNIPPIKYVCNYITDFLIGGIFMLASDSTLPETAFFVFNEAYFENSLPKRSLQYSQAQRTSGILPCERSEGQRGQLS